MHPNDEATRADRTSRAPSPGARPWLTLALSLALVPFFGCNPDADADENEPGEFDSPAAETAPAAPPATPQPRVLNESSFEAAEGIELEIDGTLEVVDRNGTPELVVELEGLPPGEHAWHIHSAPCGEQGSVALALSSTADMEGTVGPVTVDQQGMVNRTVPLPDLDRTWIGSDRYSLHIHERSGTDHGPSLACANI